ncbi:MFS transporter [Pseudomonas sp. NPDC008258]|uniref:MFS transporter n=1 Tax=Pseudomonas sp. NPDC008258 TaxID=3364418 RepID=UPI0036E47481
MASTDLLRKVGWRLLPILFIGYTLSIVDRVNISFARETMSVDIGLSAAAFGFGAGLFFLVYCAFEVPSNALLVRFGARVWLARIMVTWGLLTMAMAWVQTPMHFYAMRALLGAAEAGFYPGVVYLLSGWFPARHRAGALSLLMLGGPVAGIIVGPLSMYILAHLEGAMGFRGWQWLFLLQGAPAVLMAAVIYRWLVDTPAQAPWLKPLERDALLRDLDREVGQLGKSGRFIDVLRDPQFWRLALAMAMIYLGVYSVMFWLPALLQQRGAVSLHALGWMASAPYIASLLFMPLLALNSDRLNERRWHICGALLLAITGIVVALWLARDAVGLLLGLSLAYAGITATIPLIWALVGKLYQGRQSAMAIALVNTIASLGSFVGPWLLGVGQQLTGSLLAPMAAVATALAIGAMLILKAREPSAELSLR